MTPTLAGVFGFPVAHSRSPAIHNAAYAALDLDWLYLRLPISELRFEATARALGGSGFRGANVTIPHKLAALALADSASAAAAAVGAANTLSYADDGSIEADNTDAGGLLAAIGELPPGTTALVLGAGGAGRAAAWALREAGAEVSIWNRNAERAKELADEFEIGHAEVPAPVELLVNATAVGLNSGNDDGSGALEALGLVGVEPPAVAVDLPYAVDETRFIAWARSGGARVVDGFEVLVHQGALSFERWTGREAPLDAMRAAR